MDAGKSITLSTRSPSFWKSFITLNVITSVLLLGGAVLLAISGEYIDTIFNADDERLFSEPRLLAGFIGVFALMFGVVFIFFSLLYVCIPNRQWRVDASSITVESHRQPAREIFWPDVELVYWSRHQVRLKSADTEIKLHDWSNVSSWTKTQWRQCQECISHHLETRFELEVPVQDHVPHLSRNSRFDWMNPVWIMLSGFAWIVGALALYNRWPNIMWLALMFVPILLCWKMHRQRDAYKWRHPKEQKSN